MAVTRFAPSPTGYLHLGHAYSALFAAVAGDRFLVRVEDIDSGRCRRIFEDAIYEDLAWLGLTWERPVRRQSEHMDDYAGALAGLEAKGLLYPCFCTRREIQAEIAAAGHAPHGPDGPVYPGACRRIGKATGERRRASGQPFALRLDMAAARERAGPLSWIEQGPDGKEATVAATPEIFGDVVLARKDTPTSYHLACALDDHIQGITLVTRGRDLYAATHVHRLLQALLGLDTPRYRHHRLIADAGGVRLAKRDSAPTIRALREAGESPQNVRRRVGFQDGDSME